MGLLSALTASWFSFLLLPHLLPAPLFFLVLFPLSSFLPLLVLFPSLFHFLFPFDLVLIYSLKALTVDKLSLSLCL